MVLKFPHLCLIFDLMISRFTFVAIATLTLLSSFVWADDDKEEARPEVRLAAAKEVLMESANISGNPTSYGCSQGWSFLG